MLTHIEDVNGFTIWTEDSQEDWWYIVTHGEGDMAAIYLGRNVWAAAEDLEAEEQIGWRNAYEQVRGEEMEEAREFCRNNDSRAMRVAEYAEYIEVNGGFEQGRQCDNMNSLEQWLGSRADNLTGTRLDKTDALNEWMGE